MRRLLAITLLTAFIPVSLLGYAGFAVLGIHSHCDCHLASGNNTGGQNRQPACTHHRHGDHHQSRDALKKTAGNSEPQSSPKQSNSPSQESEECVLCQFLRYAKIQVAYALPATQVTPLVLQRLFFSEDFLVVFDYTLRPIPRGPPAIISS